MLSYKYIRKKNIIKSQIGKVEINYLSAQNIYRSFTNKIPHNKEYKKKTQDYQFLNK